MRLEKPSKSTVYQMFVFSTAWETIFPPNIFIYERLKVSKRCLLFCFYYHWQVEILVFNKELNLLFLVNKNNLPHSSRIRAKCPFFFSKQMLHVVAFFQSAGSRWRSTTSVFQTDHSATFSATFSIPYTGCAFIWT